MSSVGKDVDNKVLINIDTICVNVIKLFLHCVGKV